MIHELMYHLKYQKCSFCLFFLLDKKKTPKLVSYLPQAGVVKRSLPERGAKLSWIRSIWRKHRVTSLCMESSFLYFFNLKTLRSYLPIQGVKNFFHVARSVITELPPYTGSQEKTRSYTYYSTRVTSLYRESRLSKMGLFSISLNFL